MVHSPCFVTPDSCLLFPEADASDAQSLREVLSYSHKQRALQLKKVCDTDNRQQYLETMKKNLQKYRSVVCTKFLASFIGFN